VDTPVQPIWYRLRRSFHRAEGAHSIQVSAHCPHGVDRAKRPPRLTISSGTITQCRLRCYDPQRWPIVRLGEARVRSQSCDFEAWWMSNPTIRPCLFGPNLSRRSSALIGVGLARVSADPPATSNERRLSCCSMMKCSAIAYIGQ
jgi:hypothetical protein